MLSGATGGIAPREIVFFKAGGFSHVNENVAHILRGEFPGHRLTVIDVLGEVLRRQPLAWLRALAQAMTIYPRHIFLQRRKPTDFILRTPAAFAAIKRTVASLADPARCRAMGEAGRRFARDRFSWEAVGQRLARRMRTSLTCR